MPPPITTLFVDVGGVLLTRSWDRIARRKAAEHFALDYEALNHRHHLVCSLYEEGQLILDEYLQKTVFYEDRPFSQEAFRDFMFARSEAHPDMIELVRNLKARYGLKVAAISNDGWELALRRIKNFALTTFVDHFIFSCFVRCRKPDPTIYQMALDIAQVPPEAVVYVEDQPMCVETARSLGIRSVQHLGCKFTRETLAAWGLSLEG